MWDLLILNSSMHSDSRRKNYLNLIAAEETRKTPRLTHPARKSGSIFRRMAKKIHF